VLHPMTIPEALSSQIFHFQYLKDGKS